MKTPGIRRLIPRANARNTRENHAQVRQQCEKADDRKRGERTDSFSTGERDGADMRGCLGERGLLASSKHELTHHIQQHAHHQHHDDQCIGSGLPETWLMVWKSAPA